MFAVSTIVEKLDVLNHIKTVLISPSGDLRTIEHPDLLMKMSGKKTEGYVAVFEYRKLAENKQLPSP